MTLHSDFDRCFGLGFTIYPNDVTFWAAGGSLADQQTTLKKVFDITTNCIHEADVQLSVNKTTYMTVENRRGFTRYVASSFQLSANGWNSSGRKPSKFKGLLSIRTIGLTANSVRLKLNGNTVCILSSVPPPKRGAGEKGVLQRRKI